MATILVVDDHPTNREFLVTLLGYSGHRLLEAAEGLEALKIVRTERPDLVIADLVMPAMDGYEFVHQLRTDPVIARTQVIFCTATYLQSEAWTLAQACGVRHIITKPAEPEVVLKIVADALDLSDTGIPALPSNEFHREHLRVLTDKLSKQVEMLEREAVERQYLEEALQRERDLLLVTLTSIGDAVITTDPTATLTFFNPAAETLTGWRASEAIGRNIEEVFHLINAETRQPIENPVEKVLREGEVISLTDHTVLLTRDHREIPIADSGAPIRNKHGHVEGAVVVFRDITDRKRVETALIAAKEAAETADKIKSEFLATMSHELRTPIHVILGYTELLRDGAYGKLPHPQDEILQRVEQSSHVLNDLVTMVLDLNRLEAGGLTVVNKEVHLLNLLQEIKKEMQGLADQSQLAFTWKVEEGLPLIQTDPSMLKVIIKNIIGNAIKFTEKGSIVVDAHGSAAGIEISVTDTGIGIPPDAHSLIFEPFRQIDNSSTRFYSGSGLGLHIVKRLLALLQGAISLESEVGKGSTFRIWMPISIASAKKEIS